MEPNKYQENRITVWIDTRNAEKSYFEGLSSFIAKTKQDYEFICLIRSENKPAVPDDLVQKGKIRLVEESKSTTLGKQIADSLLHATGSVSVCLFTTHYPIGNLLQVIATGKKHIQATSLAIGSNNVVVKGGKNKVPFSEKIYNSLVRIFTPVYTRDANSQVIAGKTEWLTEALAGTLAAGNTFLQLLNLASSAQLTCTELNLGGDHRPPVKWVSLPAQIFSLRWNYFINDSLLQLKAGKKSLSDGNSPVYKMAWFVSTLIIAFSMPYLSQDFGSTWDEKAHNDYSQLAYSYLTTFGEDSAALAEPRNSGEYIRQAYRYYGEQLNTISAFAYNWLGTGVYETRHFINSIYGLIGILFTSLIAFEIAGWRAALMGLLFMFLNPGWLGHSMNNPTDIPFATGFAFAGYFMIKVMRSLPSPRFRDLFWLAAGFGIGLASRVGAFLIVAYIGLFLGVNWLDKTRRKEGNPAKLIWPYAKIVLTVFVIGYILGILIWPYALDNPFKNPFLAFKKASENAFYTNNVELFEGKRMYMLTSAPWYYVFKFLGIGNPIYLLAGVVLGIILFIPLSKKYGTGKILMLVFMTFFPILYAEYSNINYYNGWRHYLFILPFAIPLAATTYDYVLGLKNKTIAIVGAVIIVGLFAKPTIWIIKNHPNEYVYFNEFAGGLKGAYGIYETDYYSNSCREAAEWIARQHPKDSLVIGINNETTTAAYWAHQINPKLNFVWTRETEEQKLGWDYLILTTRTFSKNELQNGSFPPKGTVYTVEADGIPLAAVIKRENWSMPLGYRALDKQDYDSSIWYFEDAVRYAPNDEETWRMLGFSLINRSRLDSAEKMLQKSIDIYPENYSAYSNLGLVYFNQKNFPKAIEAFKKSTALKENVTESWYYCALAYLNMNDYQNAITQLEMAVKHNASIPEVYYYLAKCYDVTNNLEKAADNYQLALSLNQNMVQAWGELANVFNKLNKKEEAAYCMQKYQSMGGR